MADTLSSEDPQLLAAYRQHYIASDSRLLVMGIVIWLLTFASFAYSDYAQLGFQWPFPALLTIRGLYVIFCLLLLALQRRVRENVRVFDAITLAWSLITVLLDVGIGLLRPRGDISVIINDLVGVFSFYIFITGSLRLRLVPALLLSIANIALAVFYKVGIPTQEVISLAFTFSITNLVGFIFSRQYFGLRLKEFIARKDEQRVHNELRRLASTDPLTGVCNRRRLLELAGDAFYRFRRYGRPFTILVMDLDGFKAVNDTFGHQQGDSVLVEFSRSVNGEKREGDALGRMGGDEFCLVLPETAPEAAKSLAERILRLCGEIEISDSVNTVHVTTSIGISQAVLSDVSLDSLFARADTALYRAKHRGRNQYEIV